MRIRGFNFCSYDNNELINAQNGPRLDEYRSALPNANRVNLVVHLRVPAGPTSNVVVRDNISENPAHLEGWFDLVRNRGLEPGMIIILFSDNSFQWGGQWNPSNIATAFTSYYTAIQPWMQAAQQSSLEYVVICDEMSTLYSKTQAIVPFTNLVAAARADYPGKIMVNVSNIEEDDIRPEIVALMDEMFVSAYVPTAIIDSPTYQKMFNNLTGPSDVPTVNTLVNDKRNVWGEPEVVGYMSYLRVLARRWGKPITLIVGYKSTVGAARDPSEQPETTVDNVIQSNAWKAFIDAALHPTLGINNGMLQGILGWRVWPAVQNDDGATGYTPIGKPAAAIIDAAWKPADAPPPPPEDQPVRTDVVKKYGSFGSIDANANGVLGATGNTAFWNSITSAPPWSQRDAFVVIREINQVGDLGNGGLTGIGTFSTRSEWLKIWKDANFSMINNCELDVVNPSQGPDVAVTTVATIGAGDDGLIWNEVTKIANARWRLAVMANKYPSVFPLSVFMPANEPDGNVHRYCAYAPGNAGQTVSGFVNTGIIDRTEALRRLAALQKAGYSELKSHDRRYTKRIHPSVVSTVANTGATMRNMNPPDASNYSLYHYFNYNNGEVLKYSQVIANHLHNWAAEFNTSGVPNTTYSPWHLWTALQQGQALGATGRIHPLYNNEGGYRESTLPIPQRSQWNYPEVAGNLTARRLLKVRRTGMMACSLFYWSYCLWVLYNHNGSGDDGMIWCPVSQGYAPREPPWTAVKRQFDPSVYILSGRSPWPLPITAKPWADLTNFTTQATVGFHDPATWAILGDLNNPEKADPASATLRTWDEWDRATITDNKIIFTAPVAGKGNQLNRAMRPIILPAHGTYYVVCNVSGNTGTARLISRGYDAVNGLATTSGQAGSETTAATGTLVAKFTTNPHPVKHFPNLPKAAIVLECTKAAIYSDVSVSCKRPASSILPLGASFSASTLTGPIPLLVNFSGAASGGTGTYAFSWTFGDGGTAVGASVSHTYTSAGTFNATLTVASGSSTATSTQSIVATSGQQTLVAFISSSARSGVAPLTVSFTGSATGGSGVYSFSWTFGDGGTATGQSVNHVFQNPGEFTTTLTVTEGITPPSEGAYEIGIVIQTGANINYADVTNLGCRVIRSGLRWITVEATRGTYTWAAHDADVNGAYNNGAKLMAALTNGPQWACPDNHLVYPAGFTQDFFDYCGALAKRYLGKIFAYEIWNEPNGSWNGPWTAAQYREILIGASAAIRANDPNAVVVGGVMAGMPSDTATYQNWTAGVLDAAGRAAIDAWSVHTYTYLRILPEADSPWGNQLERVNATKAFMIAHGWNGPVWSTEGNWTTLGTSDMVVSEADQARFLVRMAVMNGTYLSGFTAFHMYGSGDMTNTDEAGGMGLIRGDGTLKPSYTAYKTLANTCNGLRFSTIATGPAWVFKFTGGWILWTSTGTSNYTITGLPSSVRKMTIFGNTTTVSTTGGQLVVSAGIDPTYVLI